MSAILKYISRISLILLVLVSATSCTRWHEAKEVIAAADSLLANKVVTRDTMALATAIDALNNTIGHIFAREELAKAYYFMGRNYYYLNDFSTAADYYILCDRMNPKDPIYKGRINSCMGYLCKQDSCFAEALEFYERANVAFKESGNDRRYANGLLNIAEQYINLKEYTKADSILHLAAEYEIDSVYYANLIDVKALAFYNQELYDSALVCLLEIKDYPRNIDAKCFSYLKLVQTYARMDSLRQTIPLANYILQNSTNAIFCSNVYFYLIQYAEKKNLVANVAYPLCASSHFLPARQSW